jgi:hypothetical protein
MRSWLWKKDKMIRSIVLWTINDDDELMMIWCYLRMLTKYASSRKYIPWHFIDESDQNKNKNDDFTNVFELSNENASVSTNLNDDIYDLFDLQIKSSIHSTTSTFRIQTYEEKIDRRIKICIFFNEIFAIFQDHQFRNENDQANKFFSFHNFVNYDLILWFQKIDCTKENVTSFFKSERLKSFRTDFEQLKSFRTRLSFKNEKEWLRQLNRITMNVYENDWQEQKFVVNIDTDEDTISNMIIQYKNIKKIINFLIEHSSFTSDFVYALIRQYIDNDVRMYNEMHTIDWWWKIQKRLFENVTIISLFIITNKIIFT